MPYDQLACGFSYRFDICRSFLRHPDSTGANGHHRFCAYCQNYRLPSLSLQRYLSAQTSLYHLLPKKGPEKDNVSGFMLDVSRNFFNKKEVLKVLDLMAAYKLNTLHLHLADDEGWRIEIPGIPELTQVGTAVSWQ